MFIKDQEVTQASNLAVDMVMTMIGSQRNKELLQQSRLMRRKRKRRRKKRRMPLLVVLQQVVVPFQPLLLQSRFIIHQVARAASLSEQESVTM